MKRKLASVFLVLTLILSSTVLCFAASELGLQDKAVNSDSYISLMEEKMHTMNDTQMKNDIKNNITKFKALPENKQKIFIDYISDPQKMEKALKLMGKNENYDDGVLSIDVQSSTSIAKANAAAATTYTTYYKPTVKVFGISIFQLTNYITCEGGIGYISRIVAYNNYVSKNYDPFLHADISGKTSWL